MSSPVLQAIMRTNLLPLCNLYQTWLTAGLISFGLLQGLISVAGYKNKNSCEHFKGIKTKPRSEKDCGNILHGRTDLARCFDPTMPLTPTVSCTTPSPLLHIEKINTSPLFFPLINPSTYSPGILGLDARSPSSQRRLPGARLQNRGLALSVLI